MAVLTQIGGAVTSVGDSNPYALAIILGLVIPVTGMTPLSSMVLTKLIRTNWYTNGYRCF